MPTHIRLGWKGLPGTSTQAYYVNYCRKMFYCTGPRIYDKDGLMPRTEQTFTKVLTEKVKLAKASAINASDSDCDSDSDSDSDSDM